MRAVAITEMVIEEMLCEKARLVKVVAVVLGEGGSR